MGAGDFPAGVGPAGFDPVADPSAPGSRQPAAILFDLATKRYLFNPDGTAQEIHPVDQAVAFAFGFEQGSCPSTPNVGNRIRAEIRRLLPSSANKAIDLAKLALKRLTDAGDIQIVAIEPSSPVRGRFIVHVDYVNLRLPTGVSDARSIRRLTI